VNLQGEVSIPAPSERVWVHLTDVDLLARSLPGCEKLEPEGEGTYRVTMKLGIGALSGSYTGTVRLSEMVPERNLRLTLQSRGPWGFVHGEGTLALTRQEGETLVRYQGELQIGGLIASVGQRLLEGAARMVINQFFQNIARQAAG